MSLRATTARALATAFLSGPWHLRTMLARGDWALDAGGPWLRTLAMDVLSAFPTPPLHRLEAVADFLVAHEAFVEAWARRWIPHRAPRFLPFHPQMGPRRWDVPVIETLGALATWACISNEDLAWFADRRGRNGAGAEQLQHYHHEWIARGARLPRLIEAPKPRLKALQRRVLDEVLAHVPAHPAAHGFVRGRSVVTHAREHLGQPLVVRFDLSAFFTSISGPRAHGLFATLGYPREVAVTLLALCTTRTPERVLQAAPFPKPLTAQASGERFRQLRQLAEWHLPQGAPTSPALANLAAFGLDVRLAGYAAMRGLRYSRYADDLVFSGPVDGLGALVSFVSTAAREEGFRVNAQKTRVMRAHQRQEVTGVVVNERPNLGRAEYDALKAAVHRAARDGVTPDERQALLGRIAWVRQLSEHRGAKLLRELGG